MSSTTSCQERRAFLAGVGARVTLLHEAIQHQSVTEVVELLDGLSRDGMLTLHFLRNLQATDRWFQQRLSGKVEKLLGRTLPTPPAQVGRVLLPLLVLASGHKLLRDDLVLPRLLVCEVDALRPLSLASESITPWLSGLKRVADIVEKAVVPLVPRARKKWLGSHATFDLWSVGSRRPEGHAISSEDRSYELAASVSLVSACYGKPLPPGLSALGMVDEDGRVQSLPAAILCSKCIGLAAEFPALERVFVPPEQETLAKGALPEGTRVDTVFGVDELPEILEVDEAKYVGPRRRTLSEGVAAVVGAIPRFAVGANLVIPRSKTDDGMRELIGRGFGASLSCAVACLLICAVSIGKTLRSTLYPTSEPVVFHVLYSVSLDAIVLLLLMLFVSCLTLLTSRLRPGILKLLTRFRMLIFLIITFPIPAGKTSSAHLVQRSFEPAWEKLLAIVLSCFVVWLLTSSAFAVGCIPVATSGERAGEVFVLVLFWAVSRGQGEVIEFQLWKSIGKNGAMPDVVRFCDGFRQEVIAEFTILACVIAIAGETLLWPAMVATLMANLLTLAWLRPLKVNRTRLLWAVRVSLASTRCINLLTGVEAVVYLFARERILERWPRFSIASPPTSTLRIMAVTLMTLSTALGVGVFWLRAFFDRYTCAETGDDDSGLQRASRSDVR